MLNAVFLQEARQQLGVFDGSGADEHRRAFFADLGDVPHHRLEFLLHGEVDQVILVFAHHRRVGGDDHHVEAVDLVEFEGFGVGGAGHAGEFAVEAEVVLEGGRGQGLAFALDRQLLLGFKRLVQALGQPPALHGAPGVLVDQHDALVLDDVLHVFLEQVVGLEGGVDVVQQGEVGRGVERIALVQQLARDEQFLDLGVAGFGQLDLAGLLID